MNAPKMKDIVLKALRALFSDFDFCRSLFRLFEENFFLFELRRDLESNFVLDELPVRLRLPEQVDLGNDLLPENRETTPCFSLSSKMLSEVLVVLTTGSHGQPVQRSKLICSVRCMESAAVVVTIVDRVIDAVTIKVAVG